MLQSAVYDFIITTLKTGHRPDELQLNANKVGRPFWNANLMLQRRIWIWSRRRLASTHCDASCSFFFFFRSRSPPFNLVVESRKKFSSLAHFDKWWHALGKQAAGEEVVEAVGAN